MCEPRFTPSKSPLVNGHNEELTGFTIEFFSSGMLGRSADLLSTQNIYTITDRAMALLIFEVSLVVTFRNESSWWFTLAARQHSVTFAN